MRLAGFDPEWPAWVKRELLDGIVQERGVWFQREQAAEIGENTQRRGDDCAPRLKSPATRPDLVKCRDHEFQALIKEDVGRMARNVCHAATGIDTDDLTCRRK